MSRRRHALTDTVIRISGNEEQQSDRFDRFRLISWWDQQRLAAAKVLVIGAGALGNEIVKNLALLGIGRVLIADMDNIEGSNLSRSVDGIGCRLRLRDRLPCFASGS